MRILVRTSRWARWSRRLASLSLPLAVIPVVLHRARVIDSTTFDLLLYVMTGVALAAVLTGLIALVRLWRTGDRGWGLAALGIVLGAIVLSPAAYALYQIMRYPAAADVTTANAGVPALLLSRGHTGAMLAEAETARYFPKAVMRTYQLPPAQVTELAANLVTSSGWDLRVRRESVQNQPARIGAVVTTLPGWRDEVVIEIEPAAMGARVDMRSASLAATKHDLGANGARIEYFLSALDDAVKEAQRVSPPAPTTIEEPTEKGSN